MPTAVVVKNLDSNSDWIGLFSLTKNDTGKMSAEGTWTWDKDCGRNCGPAGDGLPASAGSPLPNSHEGTLLFRVVQPPHPNDPNPAEQGGVVKLGQWSTDNDLIQMDTWGSYEFRMNDNVLGDNTGSMKITASITGPVVPAS